MTTIKRSTTKCLISAGILSLTLYSAAFAETITVNGGKGQLWSGKMFNITMTGTGASNMGPTIGFPNIGMGIGANYIFCSDRDYSAMINGAQGFRLAPGIIIVPQASFQITYTNTAGRVIEGTGEFGTNSYLTTSPASSPALQISQKYGNCANFGDVNTVSPFHSSPTRRIWMVGTWAIHGDGTQKNTTITDFRAHVTLWAANTQVEPVFTPGTIIKVSTLECNVSTPATINFGDVPYSNEAGKELGKTTSVINAGCSQNGQGSNYNMNLEFRAVSGIYNGDYSRLKLKEGGGYITGEIKNSVGANFNGQCNLSNGIKFNQSKIKIATITPAEKTKSVDTPVTWRLCSAGNKSEPLPYGKVNATAEVAITFN